MARAPKNSFHFILRFSPGESSWSELAIPSSLVGAFAFELGRSADIPATLNTGSPSFGASSGLPVSQTSWHCCGSQARPALWPQNKASGPFRSRAPGLSEGRQAAAAKGLSEGLAQHRPLPPRSAARPEDQGHLTAGWQVVRGRAGLRSRAQEVSLFLRQLSPLCCGRRLPRRRQSPARSRRAVDCMTSSRLYSPPRRRPHCPAVLPARSCHGPGMQTSGWEQKAPLGPGGGRALLPRTARPARSQLAGSAWLAGGSPPPSRAAVAAALRRAAPPGQPPWKPGNARRGKPRGGGRGRGAEEAGPGKRSDPRRRGRRTGRRAGLAAEAPKEGLRRGSGEGLRAPPIGSRSPRPPRPGAEEAPPPERAS